METGLKKSNVFVDNTFDPQDSGIYQLLLHFDGNVLNFGVLDSGTNVFIVLGKEKREQTTTNEKFLQEIFKTNEFLKLEFKKAAMSISGLADTLIPTSLFAEDKASDIMSFTHGISSKEVKHVTISKMKATLVHENDQKLSTIFLNKYPYGKIHLNSGLLIESLLRINRYDKVEKIYLDIRHQSFDLFALVKGKLVLYNQYEIESSNDLLYHVLNSIQQLGMSPQEIELYVSGEITQGDEPFELLAKYISKLSLNEGLDDYEFGLQLKSVKKHQFMSLLNLSVCV